MAERERGHVEQQSARGEPRADLGRRTAALVRRFFIGYFRDKSIDAISDPDATRYLEWRKSYWSTGSGRDVNTLE